MPFTKLADDVLRRAKADCQAPNACSSATQSTDFIDLVRIEIAQCGASESLTLLPDTLESRSHALTHTNTLLLSHGR